MKEKKHLVWIFVGFVALGLILSAPAYAAKSDGVIKLGLVTDVTGILADYGENMRKGVVLAVEEINNSGGILGKKVELLIEDDKTDPATCAEKAKKLLERDKVDVLLGTVSSATTLAVLPVVEANKKPFFYCTDGENKTASVLDPKKTSKYVFGNAHTPEMMFSKWIPHMVKTFGKKYYFIGSDYVFPRTIIGAATKYLKQQKGFQILGEEYVPLGTTNFSVNVTRIEKAKPDVLFVNVVGTDGVALLKQAHQFGLFDKMKVTGVSSFDAEVYAGVVDYIQGVYTVNRYAESLDNPLNKEFVERFRKKYNPPLAIGPMNAGAYGTVMIIKSVIKKAGTVDADKFVKAAEGLKVQLPQGEIRINPGNHMIDMPLYLLQVEGKKFKIAENFGTVQHPGLEGTSVGK